MIPLYDTLRSRKFPIVNWLLIAANVLVFLYEISLGSSGLESFIGKWALFPSRLFATPQVAWITIFTAMFLHGGWFH
ncbi:MAG TPA: rhomboid family intramembrane serine protease, partial [Anaerolineales bacterium]|nr:rhomboid family intramembrane serine protease [Anaerolineales bacterium]